MKKIPTIFKRNPDNMRELLNEPHDDCEWVFKGEGVATRKYDGTCCMVKDNVLYKRREVKKGKPVPDGFIEADFDETTGKRVGWMLVTNEDKWHNEAWVLMGGWLPDGTFELIGPKIQGNPEKWEPHFLMHHDCVETLSDCPTTFEGLKEWLKDKDIEGIVWHHPDGRMAKIKKKDFGQKR